MSHKASKSTGSNNWAAELSRLVSSKEKRPPGKGWQNIQEVKQQLGVSLSATYDLLAELKREKKVEVFSGYVLNEGGKLKIAVWYRLTSSHG